MRKRLLTPRQARDMARDIANGMSRKDAASKYGIGLRTVSHYLTDHEYRWKEPTPLVLKPCGTNAAYTRHKRKDEIPCTDCLDAHALDVARLKRLKNFREESA